MLSKQCIRLKLDKASFSSCQGSNNIIFENQGESQQMSHLFKLFVQPWYFA